MPAGVISAQNVLRVGAEVVILCGLALYAPQQAYHQPSVAARILTLAHKTKSLLKLRHIEDAMHAARDWYGVWREGREDTGYVVVRPRVVFPT